MSNKVERTAPEIRFKGFTDAWEKRKLGELVEVNSGRDYKHLNQGNIPVYGTGGYMLSVDSFLSDRDGIGIGRKGTINSPYILYAPFWTVDTLFYVLPKSNSYLNFLFQLFKNINWKKYDESTGVPSLSKQTINSIDVYTTILLEQKKSGKLFQQLDALITVQKRKLEALKQLKQALLQQMFPQKDEANPRVRFANFHDDWEQRKLGENNKIIMGQSPLSENYTDNPNDYILVQGNADIKNGYVVPRVWTKQKTKSANKGDLILSVRAPVGDVGKTDYNVVLGRGVAAIKGNEFIFQILQKMKHSGYWNRLSTGSTFESISSSDINDAIISIPTKKEQEEVGKLFETADSLITVQKYKSNSITSLKQSLLQKMFI